jgi:hypothetical protein
VRRASYHGDPHASTFAVSKAIKISSGGRGGIRTHGTLAGTPVFKTGALNHSATLPAQEFQSLSVGLARTQCERGLDVHPIVILGKKSSDEGADLPPDIDDIGLR